MTMTISGDGSITGLVAGGLPDATVTAADLSGSQSGSAPVYGCRAWCVFDGTVAGTNAPTAGGNVTTVTRNSTGDYTINFTTAMPDANYTVQVGCSAGITNSAIVCTVKSATQYGGSSNKTTTQVTILAGINYVNTQVDLKEIYVSIFR